jgi:hypothetical protein
MNKSAVCTDEEGIMPRNTALLNQNLSVLPLHQHPNSSSRSLPPYLAPPLCSTPLPVSRTPLVGRVWLRYERDLLQGHFRAVVRVAVGRGGRNHMVGGLGKLDRCDQILWTWSEWIRVQDNRSR